MAILTEPRRNMEFLIEKLPGLLNMKQAMISNANTDMPSGTPLMVSGANLVAADGGAVDATAISGEFVKASASPVRSVVIFRDCDVNNWDLNWGAHNATVQNTIKAELMLVGIRVRES